MKLERTQRRGMEYAQRAAKAAADRLFERMDLPDGVSAERVSGGMRLSGRQLKQRYITDENFRNNIS